jgi:hypothetical protein
MRAAPFQRKGVPEGRAVVRLVSLLLAHNESLDSLLYNARPELLLEAGARNERTL